MFGINLFSFVIFASENADAEASPGLMDFDVSLIFYTFLAFVVFLWIMSRFAWKPIAKMINERAEKIAKDIEDAKLLREETENEKKVYDEKIAGVHEEIEQMRRDGRDQGERIKLRIEEKAKDEAKEIIERSKREIDLEKKAAMAELRNTTLENSLKIASEVIKRNLTDDDHKKLAEEVFDKINEIKPV
ncbi:MAG: F0F1 ATP synthase subunit B [Planctomycetes bacterium]|nr:F0F1 ATP synthase subunit B [Planctomycetota bacterium]